LADFFEKPPFPWEQSPLVEPSQLALSPGVPTMTTPFELSAEQRSYFETFGFLRIPGLFRDDIDDLVGGFEAIFADDNLQKLETNEHLHLDERRVIVPGFVHRDPRLARLVDDPRVNGVVSGLMGDNYEYCESDGNLFYCESSWHPDTYSAPLTRYHVKLSFYLDPLEASSGAIRMIPGTNHYRETFAKTLRKTLDDHTRIKDIYGVEYNEVPSWTLASNPGDLIVWNFRTIHGSFNGNARRRLFSMNFREVLTDEELEARRILPR
jgi:hypothetical protein